MSFAPAQSRCCRARTVRPAREQGVERGSGSALGSIQAQPAALELRRNARRMPQDRRPHTQAARLQLSDEPRNAIRFAKLQLATRSTNCNEKRREAGRRPKGLLVLRTAFESVCSCTPRNAENCPAYYSIKHFERPVTPSHLDTLHGSADLATQVRRGRKLAPGGLHLIERTKR